MDAVTLGLAQASAKRRYAPTAAGAIGGARPPRSIRGTGQLYLGTASTLVWLTERDRTYARLVNPIASTQNLLVALGTLDTTTAPSSFTTVTPGNEWITDDVRPVFAYWATSAALVIVDKQVIA